MSFGKGLLLVEFLLIPLSVTAWIDPKCVKEQQISRRQHIESAINEVFHVSVIKSAKIQDDGSIGVVMCNSQSEEVPSSFRCHRKEYSLQNDSNWAHIEESQITYNDRTVFLDDSEWPNSYVEILRTTSNGYGIRLNPTGSNATDIDIGNIHTLRPDDRIVSAKFNAASKEIAFLIQRQDKAYVGFFNLASRAWKLVESWPRKWKPTEIYWANQNDLIGLAYKELPVKESRIFVAHGNSNSGRFISPPNQVIQFPRLTPDGKNLIYLEKTANGTVIKFVQDAFSHQKPSAESEILIADQIYSEGKTYGIFPAAVPERAFSEEGDIFFMSVYLGSEVRLIAVNVVTPDHEISVFDGSNLKLLDVYDGQLLVSKSDLNEFPKVFVTSLVDGNHNETPVEFKLVTEDVEIIRENRFGLKKSNDQFSYDASSNYILGFPLRLMKDHGLKKPLVVVLHDGPHSVRTTEYERLMNALLASELGVLSLNYRGSSGMSNEDVKSVEGYDIEKLISEIHGKIQDALQSEKSLNKLQIGLLGVGLGGLLALELSNQHSRYGPVCLINPIVDLPQMRSSSDPSWVYKFIGMNYTSPQLPSLKFFNDSWNRSPLRFSKEYSEKTLMVLSEKNSRIIPQSQGLMWYRFARRSKISHPIILKDEKHDDPFLEFHQAEDVKFALKQILHHYHEEWQNDEIHCTVEEQEQIKLNHNSLSPSLKTTSYLTLVTPILIYFYHATF